MTTRHFTAWLVNDSSCLNQPHMDVTILEDALIGEDPEDDSAWATDATQPAALYAITTVNATDGDIDEAMEQAEDLMQQAGWSITGNWDAVPNAYIVTVCRNA